MTHNQSIVMIVDDDDSIRRAVRRLMKSFGFAVETFASAEEFLGSDRLEKTSCLILDVHMPGMDGLQLQQRLVGPHPSGRPPPKCPVASSWPAARAKEGVDEAAPKNTIATLTGVFDRGSSPLSFTGTPNA